MISGNFRQVSFIMKKNILFSFAVWGLVLLFFICGCSLSGKPRQKSGHPPPYKVLGKWYEPIPHARGFTQKGKASWYGKDFHGKKTANGEIYNMYAMTAAHKTLPLGTWVRVKNLKNHREIEVRINDRGPFVRGRIIDLSYTAAKKLGVVGPGTAPVKITALGRPAPPTQGSAPSHRIYVPQDYYAGNFTVQVGAFSVRENAWRLKRKLDQTYQNAHIVSYDQGGKTFFRVRVSRSNSLEEARKYEAALIRKGFEGAFVVAE